MGNNLLKSNKINENEVIEYINDIKLFHFTPLSDQIQSNIVFVKCNSDKFKIICETKIDKELPHLDKIIETNNLFKECLSNNSLDDLIVVSKYQKCLSPLF
jgi:hypothetical protein